jgi:hypothetical protein
MSKQRKERGPTIVPFLSRLEKNCGANFGLLVDRAKQVLTCIPGANWDESVWTVHSCRLAKSPGKNRDKPTIKFHHTPKLGEQALEGKWADLAKALMVLRFHRKNQAIENQRTFVHAICYVEYVARGYGLDVSNINNEVLEDSCRLISKNYAKTTAYNLHKNVIELSAHLDKNKLCNSNLGFRYSGMRRPVETNSAGYVRLDSEEARAETTSEKMADDSIYELLGTLYRTVPEIHPDRIYILMATLMACIGRRFSETSETPNQTVTFDKEGNLSIQVFGRKQSLGDTYTPLDRVYCISESKEIVENVINEAREQYEPLRDVAREVRRRGGSDVRFIESDLERNRFFKQDLESLGLGYRLLFGKGWLRVNGYAYPADIPGKKKTTYYTTMTGIQAYCERDYKPWMSEPVNIDQKLKKYYLEDRIFLRYLYLGGSNGQVSAPWLVTPVSHTMFSKWVERRLPALAETYAPDFAESIDFKSHQFRHTINTLLDEGGLPELMQTRWFLRKNKRDTKAYQHTSREKNVLEVRAALKSGQASGTITKELKHIPVERRDAFLKVRVKAVHDVGAGICVHNFSQTPCPRHLQCQAGCGDYVHVKDEGRVEEIKRGWAFAKIAHDTALYQTEAKFPKRSQDWVIHNEKKLRTFETQMEENGVNYFNPYLYLDKP